MKKKSESFYLKRTQKNYSHIFTGLVDFFDFIAADLRYFIIIVSKSVNFFQYDTILET